LFLQSWALALFSRFRAFALASAKPKKEKKAKAPSAKEKSANLRFFLSPQ
jgi:hypothetical protein